MRSLKVPVLFIHGTGDTVVPYYMSQQLYKAAPQPKQLLLVPEAGHYRIYRKGESSYLQAIESFMARVQANNLTYTGLRYRDGKTNHVHEV